MNPNVLKTDPEFQSKIPPLTFVRHSSTRDRDRVRERDKDRKRERGRNGTPHPRRLWQIQQCDTDRYRAFRAENRAARQVGVLY